MDQIEFETEIFADHMEAIADPSKNIVVLNITGL